MIEPENCQRGSCVDTHSDAPLNPATPVPVPASQTPVDSSEMPSTPDPASASEAASSASEIPSFPASASRPAGDNPGIPVVPASVPVPQTPVVVIPRVMLNYVVIAVVCLVMGAVIGMVAYDRVSQGRQADTEALIKDAVAAAVAALPTAAPNPNDPNIRHDVAIEGRPSKGSQDAPIVMVEFGDFHCSYCKRFHDETITPLLQNYGDKVLFVFRDFPILGPDSVQAALAANCAYDQNAFWDFHDRLFASPTQLNRDAFLQYATDLKLNVDTFTQCYDNAQHQAEVSQDYNDAEALGVGGTPTFFINGKILVGAQPYTSFQKIIEDELALAANETTNAS
jgi:protein-disulfide isomerase